MEVEIIDRPHTMGRRARAIAAPVAIEELAVVPARLGGVGVGHCRRRKVASDLVVSLRAFVVEGAISRAVSFVDTGNFGPLLKLHADNIVEEIAGTVAVAFTPAVTKVIAGETARPRAFKPIHEPGAGLAGFAARVLAPGCVAPEPVTGLRTIAVDAVTLVDASAQPRIRDSFIAPKRGPLGHLRIAGAGA